MPDDCSDEEAEVGNFLTLWHLHHETQIEECLYRLIETN